MRPLRIEEVALNAWPSMQHMLYDGWLLRFSNGYTKRANSVNILYAGALAYANAVHVAAHYGLRPHRAVITQLDIAEHYGAGIDKHALAECWANALVRSYIRHKFLLRL